MSKSGFILYGAKGKIGNIVAQKGKSGTVLREKVDPSNPKTRKQCAQRAKFATAVAFFKQFKGQNAYEMAFEDRQSNESYFNAFMRHNLGSACESSKAMLSQFSPYYPFDHAPIMGNWTVASGSLPPITPSWKGNQEDGKFRFPDIAVDVSASGDHTIGELSQCLVNAGLAEKGDYMTVIFYNTSACSYSLDDSLLFEYDEDNSENFQSAQVKTGFSISHFKVDDDSESLLSQYGLGTDIDDDTHKVWFTINNAGQVPQCASACAIVISRKTEDHLLVSTSKLVWNKSGESIKFYIDNLNTEIENTWGATNPSVLASDHNINNMTV